MKSNVHDESTVVVPGTAKPRGSTRKPSILAWLLASTTALTAPAIADQSWTGTAGTDWFTAGNWSKAVPTSSDAVTINAAPNTPTIAGGSASAAALSVVGNGTLTVSGGTLSPDTLRIGDATGAGSVLVTGAGTTLSNNGALELGRTGAGTLTIRDGAQASTYAGGLYMGAGATLLVTGLGTTFDIGAKTPNVPALMPTDWSAFAGWFSLDEGRATVSAGAKLISDGGYIGGSGATWTTMTVTGQGTTWQNALPLYIGGTGNGTVGFGRLTVADGAVVTAYTGAVGVDSGSFGELLLKGPGSRLEILTRADFLGNMRVGFEGDGKVTVQNGATLAAANIIHIADQPGSSGVLAIGGGLGEAAAAPGTVRATNGIRFGEGSATLLFNHTATGYNFDQKLYGTGGQILHAAGTTNYTGDGSGYTGAVAVTGGTLLVNGRLGDVTSTVTVGNGATLGGAGAVGNILAQSGATIAPGNSPGTLTVLGNYRQAAGATYAAEIVPGSTTSDRIVVNGAAVLDNGAILRLTKNGNGAVPINAQYTILTATGGVTGRYVVTGDTAITAFYGLNARYDANGAYLEAQQTRAFQDAALTPNQRAVAGTLQGLGSANPLRFAIGSLPTDATAQGAFDALSGEIHASIKGAMIEDSRFLRNAALDRTRLAFGGTGSQAVAPSAAGSKAVWAQAYGAWGRNGSDGNAAALSHDIGGAVFGADAAVLDNWRLGVLGGYGHSTYDQTARSVKASSDNYSFGLYGGAQWGALGLRLGSAYTIGEVTTRRGVNLPGFADALSSSYNAQTAQAFGELGYRVGLGAVALEPFAGLAHVNLHGGSFTERGGAAALSARSDDSDVTFATIGLRAENRFTLGQTQMNASAMLGWRHAWGDVTPDSTFRFAGSNLFSVGGAPIARDAAVAEAGITAALSSALAVRVSYTGQVSDKTQSTGLRANITFTF